MFFFVFNHNLLFFCAFFFSILFGTKLFFSIGPCCWSSWRCLLRRVDVLIERIGCHSMCLIVSSHNHRENNRSKSHRVHCIGGRGNCDEKNEHQRILQDEHKLVPAQQQFLRFRYCDKIAFAFDLLINIISGAILLFSSSNFNSSSALSNLSTVNNSRILLPASVASR
jgi:hypothetical protein